MNSEKLSDQPAGPEDFRITEVLGVGGCATVSRAVHITLGVPVALKVWDRAVGEDHRRRFLAECRLQWRLSDHPNIVRLHWAGSSSDRPWTAMELYDTSLAEMVAKGPLPLDMALDLAGDLLAGLAAVHGEEHLHRDVKPANVLIKDGRAALADLGIALGADEITRDCAAGTARFLAPELTRGDRPGYRTDVYSAAMTIRAAVGTEVPEWLDTLLTRATSFDPADRPADAAEFRARLLQGGAAAVTTSADLPAAATAVTPAASVTSATPVSVDETAPATPGETETATEPGGTGRHRSARARRLAPALVSAAVVVFAATGVAAAGWGPGQVPSLATPTGPETGSSAIPSIPPPVEATPGTTGTPSVSPAPGLPSALPSGPLPSDPVPGRPLPGGPGPADRGPGGPVPGDPAVPEGSRPAPGDRTRERSVPEAGTAKPRPRETPTIRVTPDRPADPLAGVTMLQNVWAGRCMTVYGPSTANGAGMQLWDCDPWIQEERWKLMPDGHVRGYAGKCLEASANGDGRRVQLWDCADVPAQKWQLRNGELRVFGDMCLDPRGPSSAMGTPLQIWRCDGLYWHEWRFA